LPARRRLLLIHAGHAGGRTFRLRDALVEGVRTCEDEVELRVRPALEAGLDDLLWAEALLIGTPEHFGYMAGAIKDFLDRTFYPVAGRTEGLPYALVVSAGNDGTGAVRSIERIVPGYRWRAVAEPLIVVGEPDVVALERARELGQTVAASLALGVI